MSYRLNLTLCFLVFVTGCSQGDGLLVVEVQTDLVAGVEFTAVRSVLSTLQLEQRGVTPGDDFGNSQRVAGFPGLPVGPIELRVELLDQEDSTVLGRDIQLDLQGTTAARVVLSRSCLDMDCGPTQTCHGGRCVSRRCSSFALDACGEPSCARAENCDAPVPCSTALCTDGVCLRVGRADSCTLGRYCDPSVGCKNLSVPGSGDAGVPDSAIPDAAVAAPCPGNGRNLYVHPSLGDDLSTGLTPLDPFATVERGVIAALDGDCINLSSGEYREDVATRRAGTIDRPITVRGPPDAIVRGGRGGSSTAVRVRHDHFHLEGFTIDGLDGDPTVRESYHRALVEVRTDVANEGVVGFAGRGLTLRNALRQCAAFRYFTSDSEWSSSTFDACGVDEVLFDGPPGGWGIIIGTPTSSLDLNPTSDPDASARNRIDDNTFRDLHACVVIRELSNETVIENNSCSPRRNVTNAGFDIRSNANTIRDNEIFESDGAGIRLGGETATDGIDNTIRENTIRDNAAGGIRFQAEPQNQVCGNIMSGNRGGDASGSSGAMFDPTAPCP